MAEAIQRGLDAPPEKKTRNPRRDYPDQINLLGQFLGTALTSICRRQSIATNIVGTVQDVRDLIAAHLGYGDDQGNTGPQDRMASRNCRPADRAAAGR